MEGTLDGLAAAKARGRVGGRPRALTQIQLDQAQRMYDEDKYTMEQIAATFSVGVSTLYRQLGAYEGDCALIVYRNSKPKMDPDTNRRYGETGASEKVQHEADRKWFPIASSRRAKLKAVVYVVNGTISRVRAVEPGIAWNTDDDRGYADIGNALSKPLTDAQIARRIPTLDLTIGDPRPHVKGKLREYISL